MTTFKKYPIIDTHTHIMSPPVARKMKELNLSGPPKMSQWSPELHIENLESAGITMGVLSAPAAPEFVSPQESAVIVREMNEYFATLIQSYPTKFGAFGTLPMFNGEDSVQEAVYALDTLKLDGVAFQSSTGGKYLSDPIFEELLFELNKRAAAVLIHPILIMDRPAGLSPALLEGTFDTTRNVTTMAVHRIFDRFPNIKFIIPHTGGMVPYLKWRIAITALADDVNNFLGSDASQQEVKAEMSKLDNLYYDTAVNLGVLHKLVPASQILFGTDIPYPSSNLVDHQVDALFTDLAELGEENVKAAAYGNALRLFPRLKEVIAGIEVEV